MGINVAAVASGVAVTLAVCRSDRAGRSRGRQQRHDPATVSDAGRRLLVDERRLQGRSCRSQEAIRLQAASRALQAHHRLLQWHD